MRKKRSTVYVQPGKDVTLYIPTDTPPEVIDYLNRLKREGVFSQGVMDILVTHVLGQSAEAVPQWEVAAGLEADGGEPEQEQGWTFGAAPDELPEPTVPIELPEQTGPIDSEFVPEHRLSLDQILERARRNSSKLLVGTSRRTEGLESEEYE